MDLNQKKAICKAIANAAQDLAPGKSMLLNLPGSGLSQVAILRQTLHGRDVWSCSGRLPEGKLFQVEIPVRSEYQYPVPAGTLADLYQSGAKFSPESAPMAKLGFSLSEEAIELRNRAAKELEKFKREHRLDRKLQARQ